MHLRPNRRQLYHRSLAIATHLPTQFFHYVRTANPNRKCGTSIMNYEPQPHITTQAYEDLIPHKNATRTSDYQW